MERRLYVLPPIHARPIQRRLTPYLKVRRCHATPYQGRPGDPSHQRCQVQDFRLRLCDVRTRLLSSYAANCQAVLVESRWLLGSVPTRREASAKLASAEVDIRVNGGVPDGMNGTRDSRILPGQPSSLQHGLTPAEHLADSLLEPLLAISRSLSGV